MSNHDLHPTDCTCGACRHYAELRETAYAADAHDYRFDAKLDAHREFERRMTERVDAYRRMDRE